MKITKLNYELYAIDYLEGNLSKEHKGLFDQFLDKHPEVKEELTDYLEAPILDEDSSIIFENKEALVRSKASSYWVGGLAQLLVVCSLVAYNSYASYDNSSDSYEEIVPQLEEAIITPPALAELEAKAQPLSTAHITTAPPIAENKISTNASTKNNSKSNKTPFPKAAPIAATETRQKTEMESIKNPIQNPIQNIEEVTLPATTRLIPTLAATPDKKQAIAPQKIETVELLTPLDSKAIVSQNIPTLISDKKMNLIIDLNTDYQSEDKGNRWWSILTPKAYSDLNFKEVFASNSLTTTLNDINSKK